MSEPKFKLGDDGELEEIIDDFDEKPKRKRKPKLYNRTLHIPLSLMLVLIASILVLGLITFGVLRPPSVPTATQTQSPTKTPFGSLGQLPLCNSMSVTRNARFVYQTGSNNGNELVRVDADGTNSCRLTNNSDLDDNEPSWSPDGRKIAFTVLKRSANEGDVYIMDANGENMTKVTENFTHVSSPDWSPDGKRIVFSGILNESQNSEIFIMNADGTNLVNVTNNPRFDINSDWSPDGQSIVFASDRTFQDKVVAGINPPNGYEIYVMSPNGENLRQLTFNNDTDLSPNWSPDSQQIVYSSGYDLYTMDKNGSNQQALTTSGNVSFIRPFWLPDGKEVVFTRLSSSAIDFINVNSGQTRTLRVPGDPAFISFWSPSSTS